MKLAILGTRGVPARHGGFETFAERLSLYLVSRGWDVTVYCQVDGPVRRSESTWQGVRRVSFSAPKGPFGTILFDWKSVRDSISRETLVLTLGYNTAVFNLFHRFRGRTTIVNMDGIEWKRGKWPLVAKVWLWLNERIAGWTADRLVADNPGIEAHLDWVPRGKMAMIPYGADDVRQADESVLSEMGLSPDSYSLVVARPEPENSILEIVRAFTRRRRNHRLLVVGTFSERNKYHRRVIAQGNSDVVFSGSIYDKRRLDALRFFCRFYVHGHTVGGSNPSLIEALGAGNAVIAYDNPFNRWVAGAEARYFRSADNCAEIFDAVLDDRTAIGAMKEASRRRFAGGFTWPQVLGQYESLLESCRPSSAVAG